MSCPNNQSSYLRELAAKKKDFMAYESTEVMTWCSGCGDYGIQKALERALVLEGIKPHETLLCFDIGCNGNGADKINGYTLHGLHGRVVSVAAGACLANPKIKVIAEGGDGGTFSEGINHLVHSVRSNYPMVFILHNNENYGLTIGQASALTRKGQAMNGTPDGVVLQPMNTCQFVLGLNPTFVARGFSSDVKHMTEIIRAGLRHKGFAFIEIMQLCPTFNKVTSAKWFWDRVRYTDQQKNYDPTNLKRAREASEDLEKEIMLGVLYQDKSRPSFPELFESRKGITTSLSEEVRPYSIKELIKNLK
ncbi:2-oxoacid ferredoxin oxidoreductase [Candidatus Peregrinibacteria bacterium]|nr:2-oxoacid ferredoxin oxidoreductase [Candidatus Peregrinibacteria bacterium]